MSARRIPPAARSALRVVPPPPPDREPLQLALDLFGADPEKLPGHWSKCSRFFVADKPTEETEEASP